MKGRLCFVVLALISLLYVSIGTKPFEHVQVQAAQANMEPRITTKEKTLYVGYKNHTIHINKKSKDAAVTYKSSDKTVASVTKKGVVKPLKVGKANITVSISQGGKKYKLQLAITVKNPYLEIVDSIYEITVGSTYTFRGKAYGINKDGLEWFSADDSIAKIEDKSGLLTALSEGSTVIYYRDKKANTRRGIKVTVRKPYEPPEGHEKAKYISGLDLSRESGPYYTTSKEEYIETSRFNLFLDKKVVVPVDIIDLINHIMDMIEDETGYKFYAREQTEYSVIDYELENYFKSANKFSSIDPNNERISILICDNPNDAYAIGGKAIVLNPKYIRLLDGEGHAVIHELLHIVHYRNGTGMGGVLGEGFTTYYTGCIIDKDTKLRYNHNSYNEMADYPFAIEEDTIEQLYIIQDQGSDRYKLGFRLLHYMSEAYGDKAFKRLHEKVDNMLEPNESVTTELIAKAIKELFSKDFFVKFARWHKENRLRFKDKDMSIYGDWNISYDLLVRYYGRDSHVIIPNNVCGIGFEAFIYNQYIKSVEMHDGVNNIAASVFYGCPNLREVKLSDGITKMYFSTFDGCSSLESVKLPKHLKEIPLLTFYECSSLKEITLPQGITKIGSQAFAKCTSLETIALPENLQEMGIGIFDGCTALKKIDIPDSVKVLSTSLFSGCTSLTEVKLPKGLKSIEKFMFLNCSSLKSIILPEGVTEIGIGAFNFSGLEEIKLPEAVRTIDDYAFGHCNNMTIYIPNGVKSIGKEAFNYCENLTICGKAGSYAEQFAKDNGIKFIVK